MNLLFATALVTLGFFSTMDPALSNVTHAEIVRA